MEPWFLTTNMSRKTLGTVSVFLGLSSQILLRYQGEKVYFLDISSGVCVLALQVLRHV